MPDITWVLRDEFDKKGDVGVSLAQLRTMTYLWHHGHASPSEIAKHDGLTAASVSGLVDTLVRRKLVRRKPSATDRRKVVLTLTAHGRRQLKASRQNAERAVVERLRTLTPAQLETVLDAMNLLHEVFIVEEAPAE